MGGTVCRVRLWGYLDPGTDGDLGNQRACGGAASNVLVITRSVAYTASIKAFRQRFVHDN